MQALILLTLAFSVLVAVFALQNAYPVTIHFLGWNFEASLALVILISVLSGAVLFGVFGWIHQAHSKISSWRIVRNKKEKAKESFEQDTPDSVRKADAIQGTPDQKDGGEECAEEEMENTK